MTHPSVDTLEFLAWIRHTVHGHTWAPGSPPPPDHQHQPVAETAQFKPEWPPFAGRIIEYSWKRDGKDRILILRTLDDTNLVRVPVANASAKPSPDFDDLIDAWTALTRNPR